MSGQHRDPNDSDSESPRLIVTPPPAGDSSVLPHIGHPAYHDFDDLAATARLKAPITPPPSDAPEGPLHRTSATPLAPGQRAVDVSEFPPIGSRFLHFEIVEELSRGAFARVYLARQESLANRLVALKVTVAHTREPQNLARLRHTNIVPVYSVHEMPPFQVLCMPYLGRVTLNRAIVGAAAAAKLPITGRDLLCLLGVEGEVDHELTRMSYEDGCLWVAGQIASGLAHAHARGLLHRDVKPANILVTDDGVPMILDFNVSSDMGKIHPDEPVGGTIPYMAPEHLRAFLGEETVIDERSDLFSLGVILYELLAGTPPFPVTMLPDRTETVRRMIAQRQKPPLPLRKHNPAVSRATEAIVARLLDPCPQYRYPSAALLREDITRHLSDRPLLFAPDRSLTERAGKWRRRHPRLATGLAVAMAALLFLVLPAALIAARQTRIAERAHQALVMELAADADEATAALHTAAVRLGGQVEPATRDEGLRAAHGLIDRYALTDPTWKERPAFALLDSDRQIALTAAFGEVTVLLTRAEAATGGYMPPAIEAGLRWNTVAIGLFSPDERPAVLDRHRTELEARLAGRGPSLAAPPAERSADLYFDALDLTAAHRYREALPLLAKFCDRDPSNFRAWFARGSCQVALAQWNDAATAFSVCLALNPELPDVWLNRAIARRGQKRFTESETDCNRALELRPNWTLALVNRGLLRLDERKFRAAEADFTAAMADPEAPRRLYFLRSLARRGNGNASGAEADRAEGLQREPADATSWATRGRWRMTAEPTQAIADFDAALKLEPAHRDALVNKASVLADHLHRELDAIAVLDRLLEQHPDYVDARAGRGVYHARLGRAAEARRDAADALAADSSAYRTYQIAGLHAQLAKADPKAKGEALRLLALALRAGFDNRKLIDTDTDLDPIRKDAEFQRLLDTAAQLTPRK